MTQTGTSATYVQSGSNTVFVPQGGMSGGTGAPPSGGETGTLGSIGGSGTGPGRHVDPATETLGGGVGGGGTLENDPATDTLGGGMGVGGGTGRHQLIEAP